MPSFNTLAVAATLALAAGVSAQTALPTNPADILNPQLPQECQSAIMAGVGRAVTSCNLIEVLPLLAAGNSTAVDPFKAVDTLVNSPTFLQAFCGDKCNAVVSDLSTQLPGVCGNTPILRSGGPLNLPAEAAAYTAKDITGLATYLHNGLCVKSDDGKFCIQDRYNAFKKAFPDQKTVNLNQVLANDAVVCAACTKKLADAAAKTDGVPANLVASQKAANDQLQARLNQCPASSLSGQSGGSSDASSLVAGSAAAAFAVAASVLLV